MKTFVISGLTSCGSSTIGKLLADKLALKYFSIGKEFKKRGEGAGETDKNINFTKTKEAKDKNFHDYLDNLQVELAKKGGIVIDSKLGIHFLKDIADKCIWITASFETRAKRIAKREAWNIEKARKKLKEKEELEINLFKAVYGIDYREQEKKADFVINTEEKIPEEVVNEIMVKLDL
ncbi:cytidylate kinase family protein [Candidatus Pacearchaeota archaeon]|nr:cytidylate kinase family protein [Candidatus Pacearchaeota archaeon]